MDQKKTVDHQERWAKDENGPNRKTDQTGRWTTEEGGPQRKVEKRNGGQQRLVDKERDLNSGLEPIVCYITAPGKKQTNKAKQSTTCKKKKERKKERKSPHTLLFSKTHLSCVTIQYQERNVLITLKKKKINKRERESGREREREGIIQAGKLIYRPHVTVNN